MLIGIHRRSPINRETTNKLEAARQRTQHTKNIYATLLRVHRWPTLSMRIIRGLRLFKYILSDVTRHCHLSLNVMLSKRVPRAWMYSERRIYDRKTTSACSDSCRVREFRLQERFLFNVKAEMFLAWFQKRDHWISRSTQGLFSVRRLLFADTM